MSTNETEKKSDDLVFEVEMPSVTQHEIVIDGKPLSYTATAGRLPIKNDKGEIDAQVFYIAYTVDQDTEINRRPLIFTFNGGPGSPAIWLHMGIAGPYRAKMTPEGFLPAPPFDLEVNPHTWLPFGDLVLIDPVGTGYSRAKNEAIGEKHWGLQGDIEAMGEFIRLFITENERWMSPLYLAGESYGTARAAGVVGHLAPRGILFNGIVLVSSILNWTTARNYKGNDLPYILFLPTYATTAWYHGQLGDRFARLDDLRKEVERFALTDYALALLQGDRLPDEKRQEIIERLHDFTGLSKDFIDRRDLRIEIMGFCKELLRDQRRTVGRLDSRFVGIDGDHTGQKIEHDPSMSSIMGPYMSTFATYLRGKLGYKTDMEYCIFNGVKKPWNWGSAGEGPPDTSEALRQAMAKNPYMKVMIASGFYDLATPYFGTEYTFSHMGLDREVRSNVAIRYYESGHMMYIDETSLADLTRDVAGFLAESKG